MSADTLEAAEAEALAATERLEALRADRARAEAERVEAARVARVDLARRRLEVWEGARRIAQERRAAAADAMTAAYESLDLAAIVAAAIERQATFGLPRAVLDIQADDCEALGLDAGRPPGTRRLPADALPFGDSGHLADAIATRAGTRARVLLAEVYAEAGLID